jgi:hypothetical protein
MVTGYDGAVSMGVRMRSNGRLLNIGAVSIYGTVAYWDFDSQRSVHSYFSSGITGGLEQMEI